MNNQISYISAAGWGASPCGTTGFCPNNQHILDISARMQRAGINSSHTMSHIYYTLCVVLVNLIIVSLKHLNTMFKLHLWKDGLFNSYAWLYNQLLLYIPEGPCVGFTLYPVVG